MAVWFIDSRDMARVESLCDSLDTNDGTVTVTLHLPPAVPAECLWLVHPRDAVRLESLLETLDTMVAPSGAVKVMVHLSGTQLAGVRAESLALPAECTCDKHVTRMSTFGTAVYCETEQNAYCNFECECGADNDD